MLEQSVTSRPTVAAGLETGVAVETVPTKVLLLLLLLMGSGTVGSAWLACVAMWP